MYPSFGSVAENDIIKIIHYICHVVKTLSFLIRTDNSLNSFLFIVKKLVMKRYLMAFLSILLCGTISCSKQNHQIEYSYSIVSDKTVLEFAGDATEPQIITFVINSIESIDGVMQTPKDLTLSDCIIEVSDDWIKVQGNSVFVERNNSNLERMGEILVKIKEAPTNLLSIIVKQAGLPLSNFFKLEVQPTILVFDASGKETKTFSLKASKSPDYNTTLRTTQRPIELGMIDCKFEVAGNFINLKGNSVSVSGSSGRERHGSIKVSLKEAPEVSTTIYVRQLKSKNVEVELTNPLDFFSEYNMSDLNGNMDSKHSTTGATLFNWSDAMNAYNKEVLLDHKIYHLPSDEEWNAIIPSVVRLVSFDNKEIRSLDSNFDRNIVTVKGKKYRLYGSYCNKNDTVFATLGYYSSEDYLVSPGLSTSVFYVIAKYFISDLKDSSTNGRLTVQMVATPIYYFIEEVIEDSTWQQYSTSITTRHFPASGISSPKWEAIGYKGEWGNYWSSTDFSYNSSYSVMFNKENAYHVIHEKDSGACIRLVRSE